MRIRAVSAALAVVATSLAVGLSSPAAQAAAPSNDTIAGATPLVGESGSIDGTTAQATWTAEDPAGDNYQGKDPEFTRSVWYRITTSDDAGITFSIPRAFGPGISVGTFTSFNDGPPSRTSDRYEANGWAHEVRSGVYESVAGVASTFLVDTTLENPPYTTTYYVRVKSTTAHPGPFTLNWAEGGLVSSTTATTTLDHAAGTFRIDPTTTCAKPFLNEPPPAPIMEPTTNGYYIVRNENGQVVGPKRRWEFYNVDGTTPPAITDLPLLPGSHTYTVRFYDGSSYTYCKKSQTQVTVAGARITKTTLKAAVSGQKVTFSGTVAPTPPPGSSFQVLEGSKVVATLRFAAGSASGVLTGARPGRHVYTGRFTSTSPAFVSSSSAPLTVTVPKYATTTTLTAPKKAAAGSRPTVKVLVKVGKAPAQGSVVVRVNGQLVATRKLVNGATSVRLPKLKSGKTTVTVTYVATALNASSKTSRVITT